MPTKDKLILGRNHIVDLLTHALVPAGNIVSVESVATDEPRCFPKLHRY